jgi:hypothetical protein
MASILMILDISVSLLSDVAQHKGFGTLSNFSRALTVIVVGHYPAYQTVSFRQLQDSDN